MPYQYDQQPAIWLQLSAGQGPKECAWVVAQTTRRLLQEAQQQGISAEWVERLAYDKHMRKQDLVEVDAYLSCLIRLQGEQAETFAHSWHGPIKWQGTSPYRPKHKRCNWFIASERLTLKAAAVVDVQQLAREVTTETLRASGPGGQHVNKTSSAVRIHHEPTGIRVRVESARSQHRNRQLALERLQLLLSEQQAEHGKTQLRERWLKHYQVERGNAVRTFMGGEFLAV